MNNKECKNYIEQIKLRDRQIISLEYEFRILELINDSRAREINKLTKELEEEKKYTKELNNQIEHYVDKLNIAIEALKFYGKNIKDDENWYETAYDEGEKARKAINKIIEVKLD